MQQRLTKRSVKSNYNQLIVQMDEIRHCSNLFPPLCITGSIDPTPGFQKHQAQRRNLIDRWQLIRIVYSERLDCGVIRHSFGKQGTRNLLPFSMNLPLQGKPQALQLDNHGKKRLSLNSLWTHQGCFSLLDTAGFCTLDNSKGVLLYCTVRAVLVHNGKKKLKNKPGSNFSDYPVLLKRLW